MTSKRLQIIAKEDERRGPRKDRSRRSIRRTLARGREIISPESKITLRTDEKSVYPGLAAEVFATRLTHLKTSSKLARTIGNPLFPINHEDARLRDMCGRMRRQSWLVSKKRRYLELALQVHMAFRNLVRSRFNTDKETPAQLLGFLPRPLTLGEALSWRQCWGRRSVHPLSPSGRSVSQFQAAQSAMA